MNIFYVVGWETPSTSDDEFQVTGWKTYELKFDIIKEAREFAMDKVYYAFMGAEIRNVVIMDANGDLVR